MMIHKVAADLIQQYLMTGDMMGFIIAIFSQSIGSVFFGIVLMGFSVPIYTRTQSIGLIALIWFIVWGFIEMIVPTPAMSLGKVVMAFAGAVILYRTFMGRSDG